MKRQAFLTAVAVTFAMPFATAQTQTQTPPAAQPMQQTQTPPAAEPMQQAPQQQTQTPPAAEPMQQTTQTPPAAEPMQQTVPADMQVTTAAEFVPMAAMGNMFEIQSSEIALEKSQNQQYQQFAQQMIADHTKAGEDMTAAMEAGQVQAEMPTELDAEHQAMIDQLQNASAEEFDALYDQMQTQAHEMAVALFKTYSQNGEEGPVREFAAATLPTLESHHQMITEMEPGA